MWYTYEMNDVVKKNNKSILIIEDDKSIREAICELLTDEGYEVSTAANGERALEYLRSHPIPCLVLLDMMMPIMGGREFLDIVIKDSVLAPIPVFILSASVDKTNSEGAVGYIKKPADLDLIVKIVKTYCE